VPTDSPLPASILAGLRSASADLATRTDRYWSQAIDSLLAADAPIVRVEKDGAPALAARGSRGPVVRWRTNDVPDAEHGISIVCDQTLIPADYEIVEYLYARRIGNINPTPSLIKALPGARTPYSVILIR
jgi:hypothetical protein